MPLEKKPHSEPIRGYKLLEPLGSGGFGEVWKCEAPGGIFKAIKFVYGDLNGLENDSLRAEEELRAVQHIKSIRHPFLLSIDRVENVDGELLIVTELADHNLNDVLQKQRSQGQLGISRSELLAYLREAAEVLDLLNHKFNLQHLDIKPRNLFVVSNHVKVADFGLVNTLAGAKGAEPKLGAITPLYGAPELFLGKISRHCDQYSLAIVFQELLTGSLPYNGKNSRQLLLEHTQGEPDLSSLSSADRPLIARALAKNPDHRFGSCMELVRALTGEQASAGPALVPGGTPEGQAALKAQPMAETRNCLATDTENNRCRGRIPVLPAGTLDDYLFLESIGNSPRADIWKVQAPTGEKRLVKLLYGLGNPTAKLKDNVIILRSLHHPALVPCDVLLVEPGRLVMLTEPIKETLRDRFLQCQGQKLPGIRRNELLEYIRAAAEVLDYMYQQHGIHHLELSSRSLILDNGWLQITDFGMAQLFYACAGQELAQRNPRYAAPELFDRKISRSSDQASLALIYAEMLTGQHPYRNKDRGEADLARLPALDKEVIARALEPDPARRWPSATDMVLALEGTRAELEKERRDKTDPFTDLLKKPRAGKGLSASTSVHGNLHQIIADIIASAGGESARADLDEIPELSADGTLLRHRFQTGLPLGSAKDKLQSFYKENFSHTIGDDGNELRIQMPLPASFWGRWFGRQRKLQIDISLARVHAASATPVQVSAALRLASCSKSESRRILETMGPELFEGLHTLLLANSNKRTQSRLLWPHKVKVIPVHHGEKDFPIECRGKDISQSGLGFYLPEELDTPDVLIELSNPVHPDVVIPATLVRAKRCADGWYDVGAVFRLPAVRKSTHELCLT